MVRQRNIWHVGAWNRNYGDHVLQCSIRQNLMNTSQFALNFVPVDCQNTHFFPQLIERLNNEADLLLIGGGGLIFNRAEDNSLSGWQFSVKLEDLEKIKIPVVIFGIGYNKFEYDNRGFKPVLNEHLIKTQELAILFSVRNNGTKRELINRGLKAGKIEVIPDAGAFLEPKNIAIPGLDNNRLKIGINWVSDRPHFTFPNPYEETKWYVIENVVNACKYLVSRYDAQIVNIEHIKGLDADITSYMEAQLGEHFISIERDMPYLYPPSMIYAPFLADIYRQMDMVIGMRGHANIIPFGVNTPFIALSSHQKNRFFLEEIDEKDYLLDIRNYKSECSVDNIIAKIESLLSEREAYKKRVKTKLDEHRRIFNRFNQRVIDLLE